MSDKAVQEQEPASELAEKVTMSWRVQRVTEAGREAEQLRIVLEEPLVIEVNGQEVAVLMRLPGSEKELAVGFCISEGLITDLAAIQLVHHCGSESPASGEENEGTALLSRNRVQIQAAEGAYQSKSGVKITRLIRSGCGATGVKMGDLELPPITSDVQVRAGVMLGLSAAMRKQQRLFQDVGAVHAAALFDTSGDLVILQEDIGRHNALDKVIGYCLLRDIPLDDKVVATTGRASYEMVSKAVRVGLPIVASVSSPTALAVQLAEAYRCTLIGYMRGNRFSIYTHSWRIYYP